MIRLSPPSPADAFTSLDGGATVVPLTALGDRPFTNLRLPGLTDLNGLRLHGEVLAHRRSAFRHARTLALESVEAWRSHAGVLEVESSSSEMLFRCLKPSRGAAWRLNFQKRWLAIQHIAVAPAGDRNALDAAENLLAGGLTGGAAPTLDTLDAHYSIRASRGVFATQENVVEYRGVELGPLTYNMSFTISPTGIRAAIARRALADCLAFGAPALAFNLSHDVQPAVKDRLLRLPAAGAAAMLLADGPMLWRARGNGIELCFDDESNDLGLLIIPAGCREGALQISFE